MGNTFEINSKIVKQIKSTPMKTNYKLTVSSLTSIFTMLFIASTFAQNNPIPPGWEFQATSSNPHGMIIMLEANPRINDVPLQAGDYIGAFYTDDNNELKCGGADFWLGDENIIFAVFGDDPSTTEKDGFGFNEQMFFKVYSYTTQKSYDVDVTAFDPDYYGTNIWGPLGLSAMTDLQCLEDFDAFATANPDPACLGDEITLNANIFVESTGNYTYNWTSEPAGFTSTNPEDFHTPTTTTTYFLEVSDGTLVSNHELTVEVNVNPTVDAGNDMTICPDCNAELSASVQNYSCIMWETSGDGTFSSASVYNPVYYPGANDVMAGGATISVSANTIAPCDVIATDELQLTIQSVATIGIDPQFDACGSDNIILDAEAANYSSILWSTQGDGTFSSPQSEITQYFPGPFDEQFGEFTLSVCATAPPPSQIETCVEIDVEIFEAPTVNAPSTQTKCDNLPIPVTCIPNNYNDVSWTTAGDGTFENPEAISTMYHAGVQDKINGGTTVTVNVYGSGPCENDPVTKSTTITLYPAPQVDAGDASAVCEGESMQLNGSVNQCTYFMWTTTGDGYFSNPIVENPVYNPGTNDLNTGNFTLTLTAYPIYPCINTVIDELIIDVVGNPSVEITTDDNQTFAIGTPVEMNALGADYQSILWETSGDGTFANPNSLSTAYTPGPAIDASGDAITLSITAFAAEGCGQNVNDQITAYFTQQATVSAGNDITACEDGAALNGNSQFCNCVLWETTGDGSFTNNASEATTYIPGASDINNGNVQICLTGFYGENQSVNDWVEITVSPNPNLDAGFDQIDACYGQPVSIDLLTAENYSSLFWYTTNGGGSFCNNANGSVTYNPAPSVDYPQGCVTVYALAQPVAPCTLVEEIAFDVCFIDNPILEAGFDVIDACLNQPVEIELETAENFSSIFWYTTNGGGSFADNGNGSATYYPAPSVDYPQGCITVFALAQPEGPCTLVDEIVFDVCFIPDPEVNAGEDQTITESETFTPNPVVSGQGSVVWSTAGDGTFSNGNSLNPEYFPGSNDINNGGAALMITAYPASNCTNTASDIVNITIHREHTILIPTGWSGLSTYIENNSNIEELFESISDELIAIQNMNQVYWPEGNINTIGNFSEQTGYKIKVEEAVELTISGLETTDKTIEMQNGWNLIPVLSTCYVNQYDFTDAVGDDLILAKEIGGNGIIWPDMNIFNIPAFKPGKAYLVALSQSASFTFDECSGTKGGYEDNNLPENAPWDLPEQTTISHTLAFATSATETLESGDFIGAFNEAGACVGMVQISDPTQNTAMAVFGDEPITAQNEGMAEGENIYFKAYSNFEGTESEIDVEYNTKYGAADGHFTENGMSVIQKITFKSTMVTDYFNPSVSLYPNPSKGIVNLSIEEPSSTYQVTISDMSGQTITNQKVMGNTQLDLSEYRKGFYMVVIEGDDYQKVEKLVLD